MNAGDLRSALGLESSNWKAAGEFAYTLHQLDLLTRVNKDVVDIPKEHRLVAKQLYNLLFRYGSRNFLDNERKCVWYFGRDVRPLSLYRGLPLKANTHIVAASDPQPS